MKLLHATFAMDWSSGRLQILTTAESAVSSRDHRRQ
jgi:hypothetical protein